MWTDFVYEEEDRDIELKNQGAEPSLKITSKVVETRGSSHAQDPLEEVNLGEGSVQQPTNVTACLNALNSTKLMVVLMKY